MKIADLEKKLTSLEKEVGLLRQQKEFTDSNQMVKSMSQLMSRFEKLEQTETGRIRYEVQQMFKTVMTERDLLQWRIPYWATKIIKMKNGINK